MKIAYHDLLKFLDEKPSIEILSEKLFQLGHEHEIHGDIFEMEFTPNRGDCLSLVGLSRDLNIFFGKSKNIEIYKNEIDNLDINFKNLATEHCPKITFLEIEISDQKKEYKKYLNNFINQIGNNKTNLFTDISNYISYEQGQPTHCYDKEKIKGELSFKNLESDDKFNTLLGSEIQLEGQNCVFTIDEEIVSLAGVMGGESTACSSETKKVLVECAYFNPESIIGKSVKYNLNSDASYKFERGVDISCQEKVLRRFIKVVEDHALIKSLKMNEFTYHEYNETILPIDVTRINNILGTKLSEVDYIHYLEKSGFIINKTIKVPSYRHDIKTQNDLAEEIARFIGYNNIGKSFLEFKKSKTKTNMRKSSIIKNFLINNGFNEVINFPFTSEESPHSLVIDNPLDINKKYLRTALKNSLIDNLIYNERRQKDSIKLFEISDVYLKQSKIKRYKKLGIIISGRQGNHFDNFSKKLDYKYLDNMLNDKLDNKIFTVNEIMRSDIGSKKKDKIYYLEISLDEIPDSFFNKIPNYKKQSVNFIKYQPISEFPSSIRDFSFLITNFSELKNVINYLENINDRLVKDLFMFDLYENSKTNTVKVGYRFVFQSNLKTLSEKEINNKVQEIINPLLKIDGVSIPGM